MAPSAAFVPPPPPIIYGLPSHFAPGSFDVMQMPDQSFNMAKPTAHVKANTNQPPVQLERLKIDMPKAKVPSQVKKESTRPAEEPRLTNNPIPAQTTVDQSNVPLERIPGFSENAGSAAPLPGSGIASP